MIKNSTFNVYDRMDRRHLDLVAAAFESDLSDAPLKDHGQRDFVKARLAIVYSLLKYKIQDDWLPTPENINALPEPVRKYIHDLETNVDPAGMVRENILIKDTCRALVIKLNTKLMVDEAFVNIWADKYLSKGDVNYLRKQTKLMLKEAGVKVVREKRRGGCEKPC